jgi:hypothetical protein
VLVIRAELGVPFSLNAFPRKVHILSRFMVSSLQFIEHDARIAPGITVLTYPVDCAQGAGECSCSTCSVSGNADDWQGMVQSVSCSNCGTV